MPGVQYYLRQPSAFRALAQSATDPQMSARYRMMAQQYKDIADELAREPEEMARGIVTGGNSARASRPM
jgi:hypothetical protein